jgi:hypothetical protein
MPTTGCAERTTMFEWLRDLGRRDPERAAEARHHSSVHGGNVGSGPFGGDG